MIGRWRQHPLSAWPLAAIGAAMVALIAAQASLHVPSQLGIGSYPLLVRFVVLWCVAGGLYLAAIALQRRRAVPLVLVLVVAAAMRVAPLVAPPFLSSDLYRYIWDGRVQAAGINPYCCIPSAPELASLRDATIYPPINRSDYAPTIYPPAAQMMFALAAWIAPDVRGMKTAMLLADGVAIGAMVALLGAAGLPRSQVLVYAWNPVFVWEYAGNAHVDVLAIAFLGLALLAAARLRFTGSGVALAAATLTKFLPVVVGPALVLPLPLRACAAERIEVGGRGAVAGSRGATPPPAPSLKGRGSVIIAFLITVLALYACYASVGWRVFGFLSGYSQEEGLSGGQGIYVLRLLQQAIALPAWAGKAWLALAALVLAAVAIRMVWLAPPPANIAERTRGIGANALVLATITTVAVSPHYAWYFGWLAYLACLCPAPSVLWLSAAVATMYLDPVHTSLIWSSVLYVPFALLAIRDVLTRRA